MTATARTFGISVATLRRLKKEPHYAALLAEVEANKKKRFEEVAGEAVDEIAQLILDRVKAARTSDDFLLELMRLSQSDFDKGTAKALLDKLVNIKIPRITDLATTLGILYDKKILAQNGDTNTDDNKLDITINTVGVGTAINVPAEEPGEGAVDVESKSTSQ